MANPNRNPQDFVTEISTALAFLASFALSLSDYVELIDVSRHRQGVPLRTAKQQGIRGVICKATDGVTPPHPDQQPTYEHYRNETKSIGLPFGAFHYWRAKDDPIAQAQHFYDVAGGQLDLLPALDVEKYLNEGILSQAEAAQHIDATAQEIIKLFAQDYVPEKINVMLYTSRYMWQFLTNNSPIIAKYKLWPASWTTASSPVLPIGATEWLLWQYTNNYQVVGYPKGLDASRFHGNEGQFEEYVKSLKVAPPPPDVHNHPDLEAEIELLKSELVQVKSKITDLELEGINADKRITDIENLIQSAKDFICKNL